MECFGIADLIVLIKATRAICLNDRRSLYFRSCRPQHRISVDNSNQFPEQKNSNNLDIIFQAVAVADLDNLNIDHENPKDWCVVCVCVSPWNIYIYIYLRRKKQRLPHICSQNWSSKGPKLQGPTGNLPGLLLFDKKTHFDTPGNFKIFHVHCFSPYEQPLLKSSKTRWSPKLT